MHSAPLTQRRDLRDRPRVVLRSAAHVRLERRPLRRSGSARRSGNQPRGRHRGPLHVSDGARLRGPEQQGRARSRMVPARDRGHHVGRPSARRANSRPWPLLQHAEPRAAPRAAHRPSVGRVRERCRPLLHRRNPGLPASRDLPVTRGGGPARYAGRYRHLGKVPRRHQPLPGELRVPCAGLHGRLPKPGSRGLPRTRTSSGSTTASWPRRPFDTI